MYALPSYEFSESDNEHSVLGLLQKMSSSTHFALSKIFPVGYQLKLFCYLFSFTRPYFSNISRDDKQLDLVLWLLKEFILPTRSCAVDMNC